MLWMDEEADDFLEEPDNSGLPVTQPLGSQEENVMPFQPKKNGHHWAFLEALQDYYDNAEIQCQTFVCGRALTSNYSLNNPSIPDEFHNKMSRKHFVIKQLIDVEDVQNNGISAALIDRSSGGTWINGELVGQNRSRPLINGDMISMCFPENQAFRFHFKSNNYDYSNEDDIDENQRKTLLFNLPKDVRIKYYIGKRLGSGSGGIVLQAFKKFLDGSFSKEKYAIKIVEKAMKGSDRFIKEGKILEGLDHPCIIKIIEVIEDSRHVVFVLEYAKGGELFDFVLQEYKSGLPFNEKVAKFQMYQLLSAMEYLHKKKICHRDVKLENILFATKGQTSLLKISDFGLSKESSKNSRMNSLVGTKTYMAPEVRMLACGSLLQRHYTEKADMWSLGCVLFSLLCGSNAFHDDGTFLQECFTEKHFETNRWQLISEPAKDLVRKLLKAEPDQRLSATEALSHQWFSEDAKIVNLAKHVMNGNRVSLEDLQQQRKRPRLSQEMQEATSKMSRMMS